MLKELVSINIPAGVEEGMQKVGRNTGFFDSKDLYHYSGREDLGRERGKTYISIVTLIWLMLY